MYFVWWVGKVDQTFIMNLCLARSTDANVDYNGFFGTAQ